MPLPDSSFALSLIDPAGKGVIELFFGKHGFAVYVYVPMGESVLGA